MKTVTSVSLGSSLRDHEATFELFGESIQVSRQGMDGDLSRAREAIQRLDGKVDAIGLGGLDLVLVVGGKRYEIQDARILRDAARLTPVVDGSGIKDTWERTVVEKLAEVGVITADQSVLLVSALDRFGMAEAFFQLGCSMVCGDLIFSSHINYPIRSLAELEEMGRKLLPEMTKLPIRQLYPIGDDQTAPSDTRYAAYFTEADIIAGDFHYIRRFMPNRLDGKTVVTNTTTAEDKAVLKERGVRLLVTTTPEVGSRSFGTNVLEAALVAATGVLPTTPNWPDVVRLAGLEYDIQRFDV